MGEEEACEDDMDRARRAAEEMLVPPAVWAELMQFGYCVCVCVCVCVYIYVHMYVCMCMYAYLYV